MPNVNSPFGLRLIGRQNDTTPSFGINSDPLKIASNNTTVIARGDLLLRLATGYVTAAVAAIADSAVAKSSIVGVFWGCQYLSISQGKRVVAPYWPGGDASGDVDCFYIPLTGFPNARFVAQANVALASGFVFADIGANVNIAYVAPTVFGSWAKSGLTLNTLGGSANAPFRIMSLWEQFNDPSQPGASPGQFNWAVVEFNGFNETTI
jgi:hypothetical protein